MMAIAFFFVSFVATSLIATVVDRIRMRKQVRFLSHNTGCGFRLGHTLSISPTHHRMHGSDLQAHALPPAGSVFYVPPYGNAGRRRSELRASAFSSRSWRVLV